MKNKFFTNIFVFVLIMMTFFQSVISVNAFEVTDTIKVKDVTSLGYLSGAGVNMRTATNGEYLYCLQSNRANLYSGDRLYLDGTVDDAGIVYLTKNGFPNKHMTNDDKKDYYITQLAIWWYYEEVYNIRCDKLTTIKAGQHDGKELVTYIKQLYKGAVDAHNRGFVDPELTVNSSSDKLVLSEDGKYLVSNLVDVKLVEIDEYEVSISDNTVGAFTTDVNGNKKSTFSANEKFMVKVPNNNISSVDLEITVKAEGSIDKVYRYKPNNTLQQKVSVAALVSTVVPLSSKLSFNYKVDKINVEFSKIDVTTGNELPGAHLEIRDNEGNLIEEWVSTNETHFFELLPGKYTLTETIAPEGYELSTETVEFEVKDDGSITKVVMENKPYIEVPITSLNASSTALIIGGLLFGFGLVVVFGYVKKNRI